MRSWVCSLTVLLLVGLGTPRTFAKDTRTVLLLISRENSRNPELMLTKEIKVMVSLLKQAGYQVNVSAPSEREIAGTTTVVKPDLKNSEVKVSDYAGFVFPCMAQPNKAIGVAPEFIQLVKQIAATGRPIAAEMSAIDILRAAGVAEGKHLAAQNSHPPVVQDGNLVTNMLCPYMALEMGEKDAVAELMQTFIAMLGTPPNKP